MAPWSSLEASKKLDFFNAFHEQLGEEFNKGGNKSLSLTAARGIATALLKEQRFLGDEFKFTGAVFNDHCFKEYVSHAKGNPFIDFDIGAGTGLAPMPTDAAEEAEFKCACPPLARARAFCASPHPHTAKLEAAPLEQVHLELAQAKNIEADKQDAVNIADADVTRAKEALKTAEPRAASAKQELAKIKRFMKIIEASIKQKEAVASQPSSGPFLSSLPSPPSVGSKRERDAEPQQTLGQFLKPHTELFGKLLGLRVITLASKVVKMLTGEQVVALKLDSEMLEKLAEFGLFKDEEVAPAHEAPAHEAPLPKA